MISTSTKSLFLGLQFTRGAAAEINETIRSWALREISPWVPYAFGIDSTNKDLDELNRDDPRAYVFNVNGNNVVCESKPAALQVGPDHQYSIRKNIYKSMLESAIKRYGVNASCRLVISMCDSWIDHPRVPTFTHHRPYGAYLRLPGPEFVEHNFYEDEKFTDKNEFSHKTDTAIFVGSTTGNLLTKELVESRGTQRLSAAEYFKESDKVDFRLPGIVQYSDDAALSALMALSFCGSKRASWREQFKSKFIISLDGNGAACSRLAIALKSKSVLLKYDSQYKLFYSDALVPWREFIPIHTHEDVIKIVNLEQNSPGITKHVANMGNMFSQRYLSREAIELYVANLISMYSGCINHELPLRDTLHTKSLGIKKYRPAKFYVKGK